MNQNFRKINRELKDKISEFENKNGDLRDFILNENAPYLHTMKMKEDILKNLDIDAEFENADLIDLFGYERIISCKKDNKT